MNTRFLIQYLSLTNSLYKFNYYCKKVGIVFCSLLLRDLWLWMRIYCSLLNPDIWHKRNSNCIFLRMYIRKWDTNLLAIAPLLNSKRELNIIWIYRYCKLWGMCSRGYSRDILHCAEKNWIMLRMTNGDFSS